MQKKLHCKVEVEKLNSGHPPDHCAFHQKRNSTGIFVECALEGVDGAAPFSTSSSGMRVGDPTTARCPYNNHSASSEY